ncbi:unnamed protein product [Paramecium sonneborni]|uniref:Major facilitator superfamily (MFS) profile domain-containing protein n=1 Tax=Paramecium sonneborni TaxID=65129 RepID=A0A8S1MCM7_9CILI|nr:unnamed protein product [Paramecium sonneborni]
MRQCFPFLNKCHYKYRWGVLGFCIWLVLGAFYCFDIPTSLHNTLQTHFADIMTAEAFELYYGGLYSLYSFANIFLPFISGKIRDQKGDRIVLILMVILVMIGQSIFVYGVHQKSFMVMYLGRIISGWGIESVVPTQTSFISPYFKDDYLGFAVGLNEFFATLGSILTMYLCPKLALEYGLLVAVSSGIFFNSFSLICGIITVMLDKHAEKHLLDQVNYDQVKYSVLRTSENRSPRQSKENNKCVINNDIQQENIIEVEQQNEQQNQNGEDGQIISQPDVVQAIEMFPKIFWLVSWCYALIYSSVLGFINISVGLLSERWFGVTEESEIEAGFVVSIMWFITGLFTPLFGSYTDKYGQRSFLLIFATILCTFSHLMIWYVFPFLSLILLGTSLALAFASAWTGIVFLVRPDTLGKAYALVIAVYNFTFTLVPLAVGALRAYYGTYFYSQIMLSILGAIAFILSIFIYQLDKNQENILDGNGQYAISATSLEKNFPNENAHLKED